MPNYDIARDANGHILNRQVWVHGLLPAVTLHFAHPGIAIGGQIRPPNSFFFRHVMLPSGKAGRTLVQKADARLLHREGGQADVKVREALLKVPASAWAQPQPNDGADKNAGILAFFQGLSGANHAIYLAGLPNAADWIALRADIMARYNATAVHLRQNPALLTGLVNQSANQNLSNAESLRVRAAFQSLVDPARARAGMSWNVKYGDGAPPENTVLVLSDGKGAGWQANTLPAGCQPITRVLAATSMVDALRASLGQQNAFPVLLKPTVDFGQPCVLTTSAKVFANTMEIQAVACSANEFDVFHYGHH